MIKDLLRRTPEATEISATGQQLFDEITELSPQTRTDVITYESKTLKDIYKPPHVGTLFHLLNLDQYRDGAIPHIYFPNIRSEGKPDSLYLSRSTFGRQIDLSFDNKTWQLSKIELDPMDSTRATMSADDPRSLASNKKLLVDMLEVLRDDLRSGREQWRKELGESAQEYTTRLAELTDKDAPKMLGLIVGGIKNASPDEELEVFGLPLERSDDKLPVVRLLTTQRLSEDVAGQIYDKSRNSLISDETYRRQFHSKEELPGVYSATVKDWGGKGRFKIELNTKYTNFASDKYPSERDFINFMRSQKHRFNDFQGLDQVSLYGATLLWSQSPREPIKDLESIGLA